MHEDSLMIALAKPSVELCGDQTGINCPVPEQLLVRSRLRGAASLQDEDAVSTAHGGQAMGDHEDGSPAR